MKLTIELDSNDGETDIYTHAIEYYLTLLAIRGHIFNRLNGEDVITDSARAELSELAETIIRLEEEYHLPRE